LKGLITFATHQWRKTEVLAPREEDCTDEKANPRWQEYAEHWGSELRFAGTEDGGNSMNLHCCSEDPQGSSLALIPAQP
jgi:hypothetical protein